MSTTEEQKAAGREATARRRAGIRQRLLDGYGRQCACCGEAEEEFLVLDHVGGVIPDHHYRNHQEPGRKRVRKPSSEVYLDVLNAGCPPEYRLLCHNCNFAMRNGDPCPHRRMQRAEYVAVMQDLLSREPSRVRDANARLYGLLVAQPGGGNKREADLVLAEIAN